MRDLLAQLISRSGFFQGLPAEACRRLAAVSRLQELRKGETLFHEGRRGDAVFLLAEGAVRLHKHTKDGNDVTIKTVRPGELFAEVVLFEQDRYPVTAVAAVAARVVVFRRPDFLRLLDDDTFRTAFITLLLQRMRYLADRVRCLTSCDVEQRLRLFLQDHCGRGETLTVNLSKKEVAAAIGATPETLSRLLRKLRTGGALEWRGNRLRVDPRFWSDTPDLQP
jgi:CRP/FNR family transcriptional regulator